MKSEGRREYFDSFLTEAIITLLLLLLFITSNGVIKLHDALIFPPA